jgi:glycosyltransferase involved in cell wall biosynthesis
MLNIAVVTRYFPSSGEPWQGRSAYQTLRVLARQANVKVFYPNAAYPRVLRPRTRLYDALDRSFAPPDVDVSYFDFPALPLVSRPLNGWLATRALLPHVRAFAPDLIFSIFLYPDSYAALRIGQELSVPVVAMGIGSDIHSISDRVSASYTRKVLREVDFVVTVSEDLRRKALAMGASAQRSRSVINGCDLSTFEVSDRRGARNSLGLDLDAATVVYIGRKDVKKGLRELVTAAAKVRTRRANLQVYLVGDGADRPQVRSAIETHEAGAYIHDLPACSPDEVAVWMAAADVVTLPSYMEGCPNVVLEALACGRPVVATNVGGIPEIMSNECGRLIPPRDAAALAEALDSVLDRPWDAAEISSHWGRSWDTVARELMDIFDSVATSRKAVVDAR